MRERDAKVKENNCKDKIEVKGRGTHNTLPPNAGADCPLFELLEPKAGGVDPNAGVVDGAFPLKAPEAPEPVPNDGVLLEPNADADPKAGVVAGAGCEAPNLNNPAVGAAVVVSVFCTVKLNDGVLLPNTEVCPLDCNKKFIL